MEPCLSLTSWNAGSGWQCPTHTALASNRISCKPAYLLLTHSEETPRMCLRETKSLAKEELKEEDRSPNADSKSHQWSQKIKNSKQKSKRVKISEENELQISSQDLNSCLNSNQSDSQNIESDSSKEDLSAENSTPKNFETSASDLASSSAELDPIKTKQHSESSNKSDESVSTSWPDANANSSVLFKAQCLCKAFNGKLISTEVLKGRGGNDSLGFECCNKHQFIISLATLARLTTVSTQNKDSCESWCLKCRNFLKKMQERAVKMNSKVVSIGLYQEQVVVVCPKGHQIHISYTRNYIKTWCEECLREENELKKNQYKEQQQSSFEEKQKEQKRLFEECHQHVQKEQEKKSIHFNSKQEAEYYEYMMREICSCAKMKMEKEMSSSNFKGDATHIEIYNVYKIMLMPFEVLVKALWMIDQSQLSSHYRQLARILHPDKNKHQYANDAFLKFSQAYEICKR